MSSIREILQDYLLFVILFAIFLVVFVVFLLIVTRAKNKRKIYFYGFLLDLNNKQILAMSLIIINALFLIYTLVMKINLGVPIIIISMLMILTSYLIIGQYKYFLINGVINVVNIALIFLAGLINSLRLDSDSTLYYVLQVAMNVFGIFFYLFTALKFLKNIHKKEIEK